ncbi:spore germination protein [Staphylospora marina]|uniref:spore germination protein n=1 Tax=Staphylospora marina TaxID=2490858 RepID=UPI001F156353|nr:spore germination protein [Staphylospora marina]
MNHVKKLLFHTSDLQKRRIRFNNRNGILIYLDSLVDKDRLQREILKPISEKMHGPLEEVVTSSQLKEDYTVESVVISLLQGYCAIFLEGSPRAMLVNTLYVAHRSPDEPMNEGVVRGAHDGFVENLEINLNLIRVRIESPQLTVKYVELGRVTKTRFAIVYMNDLADPGVVNEVEKRMKAISSDAVISPGFLSEFMEDNPWSPFPQQLYTERPDRTVAHLMEGRVAVLAEGDPTAIIVPVTLFAFYQTPDDFHTRWFVGSFVRLIRLASFLIAFNLPALYISVVGFHPEILPTELIYTVKASVERVPFPPIVEALLMELTIELIREAGIRLPSRVGQTIGIVGGLVIGDAVVQTGLVSLPMIIVVATTSISSFVVPANEMSTAIRTLRFPLMFAAALFGFVGVALGLIIILAHLAKLESFGTPYFAPVAPLKVRDLKDTFIRFPVWLMNRRPKDAHPQRSKQEDISREWQKDANPGKT